ncbi:MAG: tetratricopeptide repeat protein [Deltaproteobacteria bacterium]|nr:tetratricopeptide repeat protein [Deltaproteobacteria bacterium]
MLDPYTLNHNAAAACAWRRRGVVSLAWAAVLASSIAVSAAGEVVVPAAAEAPATAVAPAAAGTPAYVGGQTCVPCHEAAAALLAGSHHDRAMQPASAATVLGNFDGAAFTYNAITSTFSRKDGAYFVRTDGPDGQLRDYRVAYTFGVDPLQQYLVEFPGGRLQVLGIGWDTRPGGAGGQRWFHLYPDEKVDYRDVLHWTGPAQNWNFMCSECHSTNVKKNYRAESDTFETRWAQVNVSCEACHGPGSLHVEWGRRVKEGQEPSAPARGLIVDLAARGGSWVFEGNAPIANLSAARDPRSQIVCGRCHTRRAEISDDYRQDQPFGQTHIVSLLDEGLYYADGQMLDEVFEYGSFLQSRMHERGVICTDCHDPHSGRLRADGNAVCATCHRAQQFDTPSHHHHKTGTDAARCVQCHMPARTYMVVHKRHDHSFRIPRPDLSVKLGTPNTCIDSNCHSDRSAQWAADGVVKWYGPTRTRGPRYATALDAGRRRAVGASRLLGDVIADRSFPAIVRATALTLLENNPGAAPDLVERSLADPDPLVRRAAVSQLIDWDPPRRWQVGGPLLADPIRAVRLEAVNSLASAAAAVSLTPEQRVAFERAVAEYRETQAFNADRAESWTNLGSLDAQLGNLERAETAYQRAIRMQPAFIPSYVNLADLYRQQGRDTDGERVLRGAPDGADVHHALGLLLVRRQRIDEAIGELAKATAQSPDSPRYAYVYAVALDSVGQHAKALAVLEQAHRRFTGYRDILAALVEFSAQAGDREAAERWARELRESSAR